MFCTTYCDNPTSFWAFLRRSFSLAASRYASSLTSFCSPWAPISPFPSALALSVPPPSCVFSSLSPDMTSSCRHSVDVDSLLAGIDRDREHAYQRIALAWQGGIYVGRRSHRSYIAGGRCGVTRGGDGSRRPAQMARANERHHPPRAATAASAAAAAPHCRHLSPGIQGRTQTWSWNSSIQECRAGELGISLDWQVVYVGNMLYFCQLCANAK